MKNSFKVFSMLFKDRFSIRFLNGVFQYFLFTILLLLAAFFFNINDYLLKIGSKVTFYAFFKKNVSNDNVLRIKKIIQNWPEVKAVKIIKPEEGLSILKKSLGKESNILNTLDTNPLPVTMEINVNQEFTEKLYINQISDRLKKFDLIEWFDTTEKYIGNIITIRKSIANIFVVSILLFVFITIISLRIMSRSLLYRYSHSFKLLKMLGASKSFIILPFVLEGFIDSFVISLLSVFSTYYIISFFQNEFYNLNVSIISLPSEIYGIFIAIVSIIGALSNIPGKKFI